ncbi:putative Phage/plasmid primase, P4 family [Candidatus Competibacter denitrificans Run_A_D11]|uniref:Phage/plasmid primase, P4 family n=1 Tax=Candidatus Competibacter denitrificans Run_A_D11 TaxID=1400863 RepID=W6M175_9GAMM|nr:phage/plasmid primase, P4 family [Candidatus Competibacter denitrificans]CDI01172.1 putative Phage/plasmid primase, P4 family [Candidatus Competibacter denitrificans Run_A_D11]
MSSLDDALTALERVTGYRPVKSGDAYKARCPCHEDHNPSLSVKMNGRLLLHCFAGCPYDHIIAALDLTPGPSTGPRQIVATYCYRDAAGLEVRQKIRYAPKDFRIRHRGPAGEWIYKAGPGPAVLYRLPELRQAIAQGVTVFVVEGEKDCDRLAAGGLIATTNIEGAAKPDQKAKWRREYTTQLAGAARVVLLPDHDEPGRAHMAYIAHALRGQVGEVRRLELPGLPAKGDVSDWLNQGHTLEELQALAATAPVFAAPPVPAPAPARPSNPTGQAEAVYCPPTVSPCTHLANSHRIRHYYQGRIWYALGLGWVLWTGQFWRPDPTSEGSIATGFVDGLSRLIARESATLARRAADEADEDRRKSLMIQAEALLKWAVQSEHERTIAAGLKLSKHALLIEYGDLNADPWLFNVQNGTVDLRTGQLRPHDPADRITFIAPITYDPAATCPMWLLFLSQVFAGDDALVAFIQRAVGWSLTGVVKERALFFLYGDTGKNGKTTLVEAIMKLVGNCGESSYGYGRKVGADTFMKSKNPEDNQRKAATLAGPRFVCTSEVDEEHRLNEQLIKDITGGDTIEGRRLYQEAFTFKPQFKPWMYGNHKPEIRGTDDAIWSRVRLVPFEVSFKGREDLDLADKLEAELPGILNWAIRGCLDWQRNGLQPPAKVQAATQAYREEMDVFGPFIAECCIIHRNAEVLSSQLWAAYRDWCAANGVKEESQTKLGKYMTYKGFYLKKTVGKIKRLGIGLIALDGGGH